YRPAHLLAGIVMLAFGLSLSAAAPRPDMLAQVEFLIQKGEHARALENLEEYLASNPRDARGRFLKGVILGEQKKTQEAIKIYTALTHDHPDLPEPYNNLAVLQAGLGQYEPARMALEMAIRVKPDYAVAHENLGDIYARMAAQAYEKAAQLDRANKSAPLKLKQVTEMLSGARR
ncbi:MAG TPA: tetratricopeptide repeat protein, partial [Burkholderiales bacterium]|nr:tetratricopeptide repeat protein [Burkholderiales bacterium]